MLQENLGNSIAVCWIQSPQKRLLYKFFHEHVFIDIYTMINTITGFQIAIRDSRFATRFHVFTNHFSQKTKEMAIQKTKQVQI